MFNVIPAQAGMTLNPERGQALVQSIPAFKFQKRSEPCRNEL